PASRDLRAAPRRVPVVLLHHLRPAAAAVPVGPTRRIPARGVRRDAHVLRALPVLHLFPGAGAAVPVPGAGRGARERRDVQVGARGARGGLEPGGGVPIVARGGGRGAVVLRVALLAAPLPGDRAVVVGARRGSGLRRVPLCDGRGGRSGARARGGGVGAGGAAGAVGTASGLNDQSSQGGGSRPASVKSSRRRASSRGPARSAASGPSRATTAR